MGKSRPQHRVTRTDGETGRTTTVGRHTTGEAANRARAAHRRATEPGSSDVIGVREIQHRDAAGGR